MVASSCIDLERWSTDTLTVKVSDMKLSDCGGLVRTSDSMKQAYELVRDDSPSKSSPIKVDPRILLNALLDYAPSDLGREFVAASITKTADDNPEDVSGALGRLAENWIGQVFLPCAQYPRSSHPRHLGLLRYVRSIVKANGRKNVAPPTDPFYLEDWDENKDIDHLNENANQSPIALKMLVCHIP